MIKANFDDIYTAGDPRPYYRTLGRHDYQIPAHSGTLFGELARGLADEAPARIVDLCCSYGVNAAVLRHDVEFAEVIDHYCHPEASDLDREETIARDRSWFAARRLEEPVRVCGVDSSEPAISYATQASLIDTGHAEDLEAGPASPALRDEIGRADLVTVSGGIGYITEKTISRVLEHGRPPRLAALCLRWVDFGPIVDVGAEYGLVTERLDDATFPQRQFADDDEARHVADALDDAGVDPERRESDGYHHTDLFLLRPAAEVEERPLADLLGPASLTGAVGPETTDTGLQTSVFTTSAQLP